MTTGPQTNKASTLRKARIEVAEQEADAALRELQSAASIRGEELNQHTYTASAAIRLDRACADYAVSTYALSKARASK